MHYTKPPEVDCARSTYGPPT